MMKKNNFKLIFFIIFIIFAKIDCKSEFLSKHSCPKTITSKLELYANIYEKNIKLINTNQKPLIPLKIHQIWIGPNPLPDKFKWMCNIWKKFHPKWKYKLWTNEDLKNFNLINKEAFDKSQNWGQKADIFRYEILYREGGVYADIDFECLKNLDALNNAFNFYCCVVCETDIIANGIIATIPEHPIMLDCINEIKNNQNFKKDFQDIMNTTGPFLFTNKINNFIKNNQLDQFIILPSNYFFPFPASLRFKYWKNLIKKQEVMSYVKPDSYAIHYWANSWQQKRTIIKKIVLEKESSEVKQNENHI